MPTLQAFDGDTLEAALARVAEEHGPGARITQAEKVRSGGLAGFFARYRRRHPGVEVHLVEDGGARLPGHLEHGDVHLALVPAGDPRWEHVAEISDVPEPTLAEIEHFFDVYKTLEPDKHSNTRGYEGTEAAWAEIDAAVERYPG